MKEYYNVVNGVITPLKRGDDSGLYFIECDTEQEYLNACNPDQLVFENDAIRWKTDAEKEQEVLDAMTSISKLAILEALDNLPAERAKFDILMQNPRFKERWDAATELDMNYPMVAQALEQVSMDIDAIKREIIKQEN